MKAVTAITFILFVFAISFEVSASSPNSSSARNAFRKIVKRNAESNFKTGPFIEFRIGKHRILIYCSPFCNFDVETKAPTVNCTKLERPLSRIACNRCRLPSGFCGTDRIINGK